MGERPMRRALTWIFILLALSTLGFGLARFLSENSQTVQLYFLAWRTLESSLGILVGASFLLGALLSSFVLTGLVLSRSLEIRRLHRELSAVQRLMEIKEAKDQLKAPVTPTHS
jgi:uncharacterized integral membrane protein